MKTFASLLFPIAVMMTPLPGRAAQIGVEVGEPAPEFELQDSSGNTYRLSDYRGEKNVVLEFFRSGDW